MNKVSSYRFSCHTSYQLSEVLWFDLPGGQLSLEKTDRFSNYDNKTNVDVFYLVKDFFDTYLFLPQVKLQKSNPLKQHITGARNDYEITYTYDFQNNLPVKKTGMMKQTRGTGSGQTLQITNQFSYY